MSPSFPQGTSVAKQFNLDLPNTSNQRKFRSWKSKEEADRTEGSGWAPNRSPAQLCYVCLLRDPLSTPRPQPPLRATLLRLCNDSTSTAQFAKWRRYRFGRQWVCVWRWCFKSKHTGTAFQNHWLPSSRDRRVKGVQGRTWGYEKVAATTMHTRSTLTTLSWKRNRLLLGRPLLITEYRTAMKSVWPVKSSFYKIDVSLVGT